MRATQVAVRAALVCGAAGLGIAAWSAADDTAAHAADKNPAAATAEHPGHLGVDGRHRREEALPDVVPAPVRDVVDEVTDRKPEPEATEEQAEEPAPERSAEPEQTAPAPTPAPADPLPVPLPTGPIVVDLPAVDPVVVILPSTSPVLLPDAEDVLAPIPALATKPGLLPPLPAFGPIPAPPAGALPVVAGLVTSLTSAGPVEIAVCGDGTDDARHINRDALRALLGVHVEPPAAADQDRAAKPCPAPAAPAADSTGPTLAKTGAADGLSLLHATVPGRTGELVLQRLFQLLPRSDLPTGRTTHLDPRPA